MNNIPLTFTNITNNGKPCLNPIIVITSDSGNIEYPCSKKIVDGVIKITIPDDAFNGSTCIKGYIKCEECSSCPEKNFEICLCDETSQCKACQGCVDGVCIDLCPDKMCHENTCVDCAVNGDCPKGFICEGGECVCKGVLNSSGECVDCNNNGDCSSCEQCISGGCKPISCPNNLICIGGGCGCPPGFKVDVATNKCVPEDECSNDGDCSNCETCVGGKCNPIICPYGYSCDENGNCFYDPCPDTPCINGVDCGKDCGCADTKECEPCSKLSCEECAKTLGCECISGKCQKVKDCGGNCSNGEDCPDGCGCYKGKCVNCDNFSEEDKKSISGCNNKTCVDTFESKIENCKLVTKLNTTEPCSCPVLSTILRNGKKTSSIDKYKLFNQDVIREVVLRSDLLFEIRKGISNDYNSFLTLPRLDDVSNDNIAHNEEAINGSVTLELDITYRSEESVGVLGIPTTVTSSPITVSLINKSSAEFNSISLKTVELIKEPVDSNTRGLYKLITNVSYKLKYSNLLFHNGCNYASGELYNKQYEGNVNIIDENTLDVFDQLIGINPLQTTGNKLPMFTYKRSKTTTYQETDTIRKVYVPKIGGSYTDTLHAGGCVDDAGKYPLISPEFGLYSGYNYLVKNDCSCGNAKQRAVEPLIICETFEPAVILSKCNTKVTVKDIKPLCPINKDLSKVVQEGCSYPSDAQVYFNVFVNGTLVKGLKENEEYEGDFVDGVTSVKVIHSHKPTCILFDKTYTFTKKKVNYTSTCNNNGQGVVTFDKTSEGGVITSISNSVFSSPTINNTSIIFSNVPSGQDVIYTVKFADNCELDYTINISCCDSATAVLSSSNQKLCNSVDNVTFNLAIGGMSFPVDIYTNSGSGNDFTKIFTADTGSYITTVNTVGDYKFKVIDSKGCEKISNNLIVSQCTDSDISIAATSICSNTSTTLSITGEPNQQLRLVRPNGPVTITLDGSGDYSESVNISGTYTLQNINGTVTFGSVSLLVNPVATLNNITMDSTFCSNIDKVATVTGTPGTNVSISFGDNANISFSDVINSNGTVQFTHSYALPGSYTVIATPSNGCGNGTPVSTTVTVTAKPQIILSEPICTNVQENSSDNEITFQVIPASVIPTHVVTSSFPGSPSIQSTPLGNGFYKLTSTSKSITYEITASQGGCSTTAIAEINCGCPNLIDQNTIAHGKICAVGSSYTITEAIGFTTTGLTVDSYSQAFLVVTGSNDKVSMVKTPNTNSFTYSGALPATWDTTKGLTIEYIGYGLTPCKDSNQINPVVTILPPYTVIAPNQFCLNSSNTFTISPAPDNTNNILWKVHKNGILQTITNNTSATFNYTPDTSVQYRIEASVSKIDGSGCPYNSTPLLITPVNCCPIITITGDSWSGCGDINANISGAVTPYQDVNVTYTVGNNPTVINGSFSNLGSAITIYTDAILPSSSLTYTVYVKDANGCEKTSTLPIYVKTSGNCCPGGVIINPTLTTVTNLPGSGIAADGAWGGLGTYKVNSYPWTYTDGGAFPTGSDLTSYPWNPSILLDRRMNRSAIAINQLYNNAKFIATANALAIGFSVDNFGTLFINNVKIAEINDNDNGGTNYTFKKWWVFDIPVSVGDCIEIRGTNIAGVYGIALEAYDINTTALSALTTETQVDSHVAFSTRTVTVNSYNCSSGSYNGTCSTPSCGCRVVSVTNIPSSNLNVGDTLQLTITPSGVNGTWNSNVTSVLTISPTGLLTAISSGRSLIQFNDSDNDQIIFFNVGVN
jgi:hypothetical protein